MTIQKRDDQVVILQTINQLVETKKIPPLDEAQMSFLSQYLFTKANRLLRIQVAEIAYLDHDHPNALDLFLVSTLPLARKMAERKAYGIFEIILCVFGGDYPLQIAAVVAPTPGAATSVLLTVRVQEESGRLERLHNYCILAVEEHGFQRLRKNSPRT